MYVRVCIVCVVEKHVDKQLTVPTVNRNDDMEHVFIGKGSRLRVANGDTY